MVNNSFPTALYYTICKYTSCIDLPLFNLHEEKVKIVSLKKAGMAGLGRNQRGRPGVRFPVLRLKEPILGLSYNPLNKNKLNN